MLILAFETSAKAVSAALLRDGVLLAEYMQNSGQTHSRTLMKMAEDMLTNCDLTPADVNAVACAAGPGSFTGVRIGLAAAKGFCWAAELPCYGVSTLEGMAQNVPFFEGIICCSMDARRNQIYNALFRSHAGHLTRLTEDRAIALSDLETELRDMDACKIIVGDGAKLCYNSLNGKVSDLYLAPEHLQHQRASGIALVAQRMADVGISASAAQLTPNYLRLSQAERERIEHLNKQNQSIKEN